MKMNQKMRGGFTLVELLVVIVIIAALAGLTAPMVIRQRKKADQTEAVSNARQIGIALMEFDTEYGSFPGPDTAKAVADATETTISSGTTANDMLRQLIRAGIAQTESMFFAKTAFSQKPDNVFNGATNALEAGELGFGYIVGAQNKPLSSAGNPSRPILAAPLALALDGTFDSDYYDGKAVTLRMDNSVSSLNIVKSSGKVLLAGKPMLDSGDDTIWGTQISPAWAYPIKK
ncbi:MAG: prepilin-type N-terminal cleavage/methylation domain-containing protein [Verrucomicrobia bacterium]|nr:MAG: prepilin-type N-terminal cleavage/methylation domain-containing protein [Verrucomicrobiota bacterium]